jgi:hypothetical protein
MSAAGSPVWFTVTATDSNTDGVGSQTFSLTVEPPITLSLAPLPVATVRTSPLCDSRRFTRELEDIYRQLRQRWLGRGQTELKASHRPLPREEAEACQNG